MDLVSVGVQKVQNQSGELTGELLGERRLKLGRTDQRQALASSRPEPISEFASTQLLRIRAAGCLRSRQAGVWER